MDSQQSPTSSVASANHKWWAVAALYESLHPGVSLSQILFEVRVILVDANDMDEAERIGLDLAHEYESEYFNVYGELVIWKLRKITAVVHLQDKQIGHGIEVYNDWIVKKRPRGKKPKRKPIVTDGT